jgi:cell division protein FtsB
MQAKTRVAESRQDAVPRSLLKRMREYAWRVWRPVASALAVALALLILWHWINGKNGLLDWQQKSVVDSELRKEIDDLKQENARLREQIVELNSNPEAIGIVARGKLHYAKPNEVIVKLPPKQKTPAQPAETAR